MSQPPALPPPLPAAPPLAVLDYHRNAGRPALPAGDRGLLLASAAVTTLIGLALVGGVADLLVVTWPSFGVTLIAVPVVVLAVAFWTIAYAAVRAAMQRG